MKPFCFLPSIPSTLKPFVAIGNCLFLFVITLTSMIYIILAYSSLQDNTFQYMQLIDNWNQPYISNISSTLSPNCPGSSVPLISYRWRGTHSGCDCRNIWYTSDFSKKIYEAACNHNQTKAGCINLSPIPGRDMENWVGYRKWCGEKAENQSFIQNADKAKREGGCASGYRNCDENGDKNFRFCVKKESSCPITALWVGKGQPAKGDFNESLMLDEEKGLKLFWSRSQKDRLPISEIRVSEGGVCMDNKIQNIENGRRDYLLSVNERTHCSDIDERFQQIDKMTEREFFYYNKLDTLVSALPEFELSNSALYGLYNRNYIPFNINCRSYMGEMVEFRDKANSIHSFQLTLMIVSIIFSIFLIAINTNYSILKNDQVKLQFIFGGINYTIRFILMAMIISAINKSSELVSFFTGFQGMNCSDQRTNEYFDYAGNNLSSSVLHSNNVALYLYIAPFVIEILCGLYSAFVYFQKKTSEFGNESLNEMSQKPITNNEL